VIPQIKKERIRKAGKQEKGRKSEFSHVGDTPNLKRTLREIEEQAMFLTDGFEVGAHDREVDVLQVLDRLQLDNDCCFNEDVEAMTTNALSIVADLNFDLMIDSKPSLAKFDEKRFFIDCFQEPGPQSPVDFDRSTNDTLGQFFEFECHNQLRCSCLFPDFLLS
jgi:hypothetical protein